jgi:hypothetical protein
MREHGVSEIMTADADFRKFPFLKAPTRSTAWPEVKSAGRQGRLE